MSDLRAIEPEYTVAQREELARIEFLLAELRTLRDRGLLAEGSLATVEEEKAARRIALELLGRASGLVRAARALTGSSPAEALAFADEARSIAPGLAEAWPLSAVLRRSRGDLDGAIAVCREGLEVHGIDSLRSRLAAFESERAQKQNTRAISEAIRAARAAFDRGGFETALADCQSALARDPGHPEALELALECQASLGKLDEAAAICERLRTVLPTHAADWRLRLTALQRRADPIPGKPAPSAGIDWIDERPTPAEPPPVSLPTPALRWSMIAGEFLEEHWQKLILSLAVLLIVVGSTVGAALVLGDKLWRAEGKCLLATAYTLMFAGVGRGLARWGAERAGRIMRLTTLIVLPLNFALVDELPQLGRSSALSAVVFAVDVLAMSGLAVSVCRGLGISGGLGTAAGLIALGIIDAFTPRSVGLDRSFATLVAASAVFAAAGAWLGSWLSRRTPEKSDEADAPYFACGLLAFAFLTVLIRIGATLLHLSPTLYALPAMLAAAGALAVAGGLERPGIASRPRELLKLAGYVLAMLAFALGLARPPERLAIYSGSTLATAIAGLGLFVFALARERRPAFLYASFAAAFLAYFGTRAFLADLFAPFESTIGHVLGYGHRLPSPFRALNGLAFNAALAGLAVLFARRWKDARLAWHCQAIGLPVSLAACALSAFEPLAGVLTLSAYIGAFGVGAWLFDRPALVYLACAAFVGAALEASTFLGDLAIGARSLALALVGLALWASCRALAGGRPEFREPVSRSSRAVALVALALAACAAWPGSPASWTTAAAGWSLAVLYLLIGLQTPRTSIALAAGSCAAVAVLVSARVASIYAGLAIGLPWLACCAAAVGAAYSAAGPRLRRFGREWADAHVSPLLWLSLILSGMASWLVGEGMIETWDHPRISDYAGIAAALAVVSATLMMASAWSLRSEILAFSATLAASTAALAGLLGLALRAGWPASPSLLALTAGMVSLVLVGLGDRLRGRPTERLGLYRRSLLILTFAFVTFAWITGGIGWQETRVLAVVLTLTALSLAVASRSLRTSPLPALALSSGLAAWICGWDGPAGFSLQGLPADDLYVSTYLVVILACAESCARARGWTRANAFPGALDTLWLATDIPVFVGAGSLVALGLGSVAFWTGDFRSLTGVLALCAVVVPWLNRFRQEPGRIHFGLILAWLASASGLRWLVGGGMPFGDLLAYLALITAVDGLILCAVRLLARRRWPVAAPCRDIGLVLGASAFTLAVGACGVEVGSFWVSVLACLLLLPPLVIAAALDRRSFLVYATISIAVAAAYLSLFELGRGRTPYVPALGLLATLLALSAWCGERAVLRWLREDWRGLFSRPLRDMSIVLAFLAFLPDIGAPIPLLLAAFPFIFLVKSLPSATWLYPCLIALVGAAWSGIVSTSGEEATAAWAVGGAFLAWGLGLLLGRSRDRICRRFDLPVIRFEFPPYQASLFLALIAIALRVSQVAEHRVSWSFGIWMPLALALLCLMMLKPYPIRGWVDGFVGLTSFAVAALASPVLAEPMGPVVLALLLALLWRAAQWSSAIAEQPVCRRLGVRFDAISGVANQWSLGLLLIAACWLAAGLIPTVLGAAYGYKPEFVPPTSAAWWTGLAAILLFGANLDLAGRVMPGRLSRLAIHATALPLVCWLGVPGSPILRTLGISPHSALSLGTVGLALATARLSSKRMSIGLAVYSLVLAALAIGLTGLRIGTATTATLFLAVRVVALNARRHTTIGIVHVGSALWMGAWLALGLQVSKEWGWNGWACMATGQAIAALGFLGLAGRNRSSRLVLAQAIEGAAILACLFAALAIGFGLLQSENMSKEEFLTCAGILILIGLICSVVAARWERWEPAAATQVAILAAYGVYRAGFAGPAPADSMAVLILAGIDLGIAEVTGRLRRTLFAWPALAAGLILPLLSVALALRHGTLENESLFILFAAGAFYAAAGGRLGRTSLMYPAGVLLNAALWVLWARAGWRLADDPQFYLVPVGMSMIFFSEANRRALGRSNVNSIRGISLILIYLSLAVPIWQTASLAAWIVLLVASLMAIFAGIGLRSRSFLWLGLAGFLLDVLYQLGRIGMEHMLARAAIMLAMGIVLVLFVALNEKKRLVLTLKGYLSQVRDWD